MTDPNPAYVPKIGDTVRRPDREALTVEVTAAGTENFLGVDSWSGVANSFECTYPLDGGWVKVEPTPADRYGVFDKDGCWRCEYDNLADALDFAAGVNQTSSYAPYRVARFSFAEWVEQ